MAIIPPYLRKGDTIGILCPAGYMPLEKAATCIEVLQQWGYKVKVGKTVGQQHHYFAGTDEERLAELQQMLDDTNIKAILCARGGYGISRIIDALDLKKFKKHPKWIIGFSDVTLLHTHILKKTGIATLHAPMAAAFNDGAHEQAYVQSLKKALTGKKGNYTCPTHHYNNKGTAIAPIVGGNLALINHQLATPSDINPAGKLLFIEDVGEYIYSLDRMLQQLKRAGRFEKLAGLIVGGFTDMKDTTIPFGKDIYEVIHDVVKEYNYPVCFQFPVGHQPENYALKIGVTYELKVGKNNVSLKQVA
ncbi:S66 peptidase family protein [Aridibaculum aurantiacum]|uniref:S66 peptidase family protein n=1 Tax=Aridibaculum aurantiacum TaxID=2810307 RepID=UPI001A9596D3|nr:LD-carboxypeptidase [Aridibaculum aurantiacum]